MSSTHELHSISDDELLRRLSELLRNSRRVESDLIAHIAEVDARRLYAREAASSMFTYCTEVLHLSEAEAYLRIAAARASRKYPLLLAMLSDGRLHLSGMGSSRPTSLTTTAMRFSHARSISRNARSRNWSRSSFPGPMCHRRCERSLRAPRPVRSPNCVRAQLKMKRHRNRQRSLHLLRQSFGHFRPRGTR